MASWNLSIRAQVARDGVKPGRQAVLTANAEADTIVEFMRRARTILDMSTWPEGEEVGRITAITAQITKLSP